MKKANKSKKKNRTGRKPLPRTPRDNTTTLAIKCYEEQCIGGIEKTLMRIKQMDRNRYECYAIVHDKTGIKKHLHIAIRVRGKKTTDSEKVSRILKDFGINFREEDTLLMHKHGLETLGSWTGFFIYLCHEDETSKSLGKATYSISEFITNLEPGVFRSMMQGKLPNRKNIGKEQFYMDCDEAKLAGYALWNIDRWMNNKRKDYVDYSKKRIDLIKEFFEEGRNERIGAYIPQIIIVINISANKSFDYHDIEQIARTALADMHLSVDTDDDKDKVDAYINHVERNDIVIEKQNSKTGKIEERFRTSYFEYSNKVEKEQNKNSFYETHKINAWTYKILVIDDESVNNIVLRRKNLDFYYCVIGTHKKQLCCIDVKQYKQDSYNVKLDGKKLYIDFMKAFNMRLETYMREPEKTDSSIQPVYYDDILVSEEDL